MSAGTRAIPKIFSWFYSFPPGMSLCSTSVWPLTASLLFPVALTKITNQLPLFAAYRVFTVHNIIPHYMFRLYGHPQVYHIYKNAKIIL
jgi:ABC-type transport system involved in cytochrome bd biosynthesis fused ATPase/permease subunit